MCSRRPDEPGGRDRSPNVYLKSLEMIGFKSFADRTKLQFEPGLIAIVGPNGCGKSNVSDAIRWVLGEQRPTALRGTKMLDVLFNGTDARPAMNMAEVSITFADCDKLLDTEFNEITVSRRIFRSGEGAYFINKNPCRLRDIQRLFMGTGIGTTSYSVMAQGQIDAILSSRPEDRRGVFEEAAGITKFKADRKEAMRKLDQTEANLLRLADVIREVKRQIGSLQRQAGKARRYQELKEELRGLDLFVIRRRLTVLDARLRELVAELAELAGRDAAGQEAVATAEEAAAAIRAEIVENERHISEMGEAAAQDAAKLAHAREMITVSEQRIAEYQTWSARDTREAAETREQLTSLRERLTAMAAERQTLEEQLREARGQRDELQQRVTAERQAIDQQRRELQGERDKSLERERRATQLQNRLTGMEARQRAAHVQRERLAAEQAHLAETSASRLQQRDALAASLEELRAQAQQDAAALATIEEERRGTDEELRGIRERHGQLSSQRAAKRAQIDLLTEQEARAESFPGGSRLLLDAKNPLKLDPGVVLGTLAAQFKVSARFRPALEAVLRAWIDAIVLRSAGDATEVLRRLIARGGPASARLIAAEAPAVENQPAPPAPEGLTPLADHLEVAEAFAPAAGALLKRVFLAETLEQVPSPLPRGITVVTLAGTVFHANGFCEHWMPEGQSASPLARRMAIEDATGQIEAIDAELADLKKRLDGLVGQQETQARSQTQARQRLDESRRQAAQKEGEWQSVCRDVKRDEERQRVVGKELELAVAQARSAEEEQAGLAGELEELVNGRAAFSERLHALQNALQERETGYQAQNQTFAEARIRESALAQQLSHHIGQTEIYEARVTELQRQLEGRSQGVQSYDESIRRLTEQISNTQAQLEPMRQRADESRQKLEALRRQRDAKAGALAEAENKLAARRQALEKLRASHGALEVEQAETRLRRQNHLDRLLADYQLNPAQLVAESDPKWGTDGEPTIEKAEARLAVLNRDIQEMGPVNLVAIDEYKTLEERFALLKAQEEDLLKAKEQVLDLLRMINKKTSEMFRETFEQANTNFEHMFTKLFNGGTAKLVLIENPDDPLECGVEIIARPPGKRLQSISLLSGGERTMTAVSLLFAIYMIKPSPFCLLDELDASLDDSNIGRFVQALKDFLAQSQFLIITHNRHTIASSDIVYGVTMPEKGVSRILSMRLPDIGARELEAAAEPQPEAPPTLPPKRRRRKKTEEKTEEKTAKKKKTTSADKTDGPDETDEADLPEPDDSADLEESENTGDAEDTVPATKERDSDDT